MGDIRATKNGNLTVVCFIYILKCESKSLILRNKNLYNSRDTRRCLRYLAFYEKKSYFAFVGDTRIQELYEAFVQQIQVSNGAITENPESFHKSFIHTEDKLKLKVEYFRYPDVSFEMIKLFR